MLSEISISNELKCVFSILLEVLLKGNMEVTLEEEIKNVTQKNEK